MSEAVANETDDIVTVTITLSRLLTVDLHIDYRTAGGSAREGIDYTPATGTATIAAGTRTTTVEIPIVDDDLDEAEESFSLEVTFTNPLGIELPPPTMLSIEDNDDVEINVADVSILESVGSALVPVSLSNPSDFPVTVEFSTTDGTAQAGGDFTQLNDALTFSPGTTRLDISVPIADDMALEGQEALTVSLGGAAGGANGAVIVDGVATVTIEDGGEGYDGWVLNQAVDPQNADPSGDLNGDGFANLFHFLLGVPLLESIPTQNPGLRPYLEDEFVFGKATFFFRILSPSPEGVLLEVEESSDGRTWNVVASKNGPDPWAWRFPTLLFEEPASGGYQSVAVVASKLFSVAPEGFFRLRASFSK